ncbi:MAG: hypothetical protein ABL921_34000 [Pirellula sp.]
MTVSEIVQTQWWLMSCSFPSLNWARLRVYSDTHADIFDMDGHLLTFPTLEQAREHLLEDEYVSLDNLDLEDCGELRIEAGQLTPQSAASDAELLSQMFISRGG